MILLNQLSAHFPTFLLHSTQLLSTCNKTRSQDKNRDPTDWSYNRNLFPPLFSCSFYPALRFIISIPHLMPRSFSHPQIHFQISILLYIQNPRPQKLATRRQHQWIIISVIKALIFVSLPFMSESESEDILTSGTTVCGIRKLLTNSFFTFNFTLFRTTKKVSVWDYEWSKKEYQLLKKENGWQIESIVYQKT